MSDCTHDCGSCGQDCKDRIIEKDKPHELSSVKKMIGIVSGKGGVGKSLVTALLSVIMQRRGHRVAIIDADVTGPSIPKMFGVRDRIESNEWGMIPARSKMGIEMISVNLLLRNETDPVVWRGPVISGTIKQFWTDFIWKDIDYMFLDMPPGTGDVPLTVFQSLPLDGIIIVSSPQDLVSMIVSKAIKMAQMMNIPVLGMVENMSYVKCPDCGKQIHVYGESRAEQTARENGIPLLARIPLEPSLAGACDRGMIELFDGDWLENAADQIEAK